MRIRTQGGTGICGYRHVPSLPSGPPEVGYGNTRTAEQAAKQWEADPDDVRRVAVDAVDEPASQAVQEVKAPATWRGSPLAR